MTMMKTVSKNLIPPKLLADLENVLADVATGTRDAGAMDQAARDMDRMREETRKQFGTVDMSVDLIREGRDEA